MIKDTYCYVSGPISKGPLIVNVRNAVQASTALMRNGIYVYCPHLDMIWSMMDSSITYEEFLWSDLGWVKKCDCILRLPGESLGADREVECARSINIPIFFSVTDVINFHKSQQQLEEFYD